MAPPVEFVSFAFAVAGTAMVALLQKPIRRPGKPGSTGFAVALVGVSVWCLSLAVNYSTASEAVSVASYNVLLLSTSLTAVGWFLLAVEFTNVGRLTPELVGGLAAYVALEQLVVWSNDAHGLVLTAESAMDGTILVPAYGPGFWVQATVSYGLILVGIGLLAREWARTEGLRRRQVRMLLLASVPAIAGNVINISGLVATTYDLSPIGFVASGLLLALGLYRVEFLDVVPIARQTAMEEMADAVVTVDGENRVVDCNAAAVEMFGVTDDYVGMPAADLFEPVVGDHWDRLETATDLDTHVTADDGADRRHYSLAVSPVEVGEGAGIGRVFVWRDVTPLMRQELALQAREQKLDLLRQVMSRVLRHNLRNELTVVRGNADLIASTVDDESVQERVGTIKTASDDLLAISEKARTIERIVDTEVELVDQDLRSIAEDAADAVAERYPAVTVSVQGTDRCPVRASPDLDVAVENLVENAAEYNDATEPRVTVTVDADDGPRLTVADNGPGIPHDEVSVLDAGRETPLNHGSGIGLWLVTWIVNHSGGSLSFESDADGTEVTVELPDPHRVE